MLGSGKGLDCGNDRRRALSVQVAISQSQPRVAPCLGNCGCCPEWVHVRSYSLLNRQKLLFPDHLGEPLQQRVADWACQFDQVADSHCYLGLNLRRELLDPLQVLEDRSLVEQ